MLLSFYTLLGRLYYPPNYALIFLKKEKKKKLGFSLNSFSVPGLISCVRVNVFRFVFCFCCCCFLLFGFICSPLVPYFTALWCRKKQKQNLKITQRQKRISKDICQSDLSTTEFRTCKGFKRQQIFFTIRKRMFFS